MTSAATVETMQMDFVTGVFVKPLMGVIWGILTISMWVFVSAGSCGGCGDIEEMEYIDNGDVGQKMSQRKRRSENRMGYSNLRIFIDFFFFFFLMAILFPTPTHTVMYCDQIVVIWPN